MEVAPVKKRPRFIIGPRGRFVSAKASTSAASRTRVPSTAQEPSTSKSTVSENIPPVEQSRSVPVPSNQVEEMNQDDGYMSADYGGGGRDSEEEGGDQGDDEDQDDDEEEEEEEDDIAREALRRKLAKGKGKAVRNNQFLDQDDTAQDTLMAGQYDHIDDFAMEEGEETASRPKKKSKKSSKQRTPEPLSESQSQSQSRSRSRSQPRQSTSKNQHQNQASGSNISRKENRRVAVESDGIGEDSDSSDVEIITRNRRSKVDLVDSSSDFDPPSDQPPPKKRRRPTDSPQSLKNKYKRVRPHEVVDSDEDVEGTILRAKPKNFYKTGHNVAGGRNFWTEKETKCLLAEMASFEGSWKKIYARRGPDGTVSQTLRRWNVNQLSNRARNIKTTYLKSGYEIPWFLEKSKLFFFFL